MIVSMSGGEVAVAKQRGDVPDTEILAALQERIERVARGGAPNAGRFCGYCFARLGATDHACKVCRRRIREYPAVDSIPAEVLLAYLAHRKKMVLWVNVFAFVGIFISILIAGCVVLLAPGAFKLLAVPVLLGGSWYFANLLGGGLGGYIGGRSGAAARLRRWQKYLRSRDPSREHIQDPDGSLLRLS